MTTATLHPGLNLGVEHGGAHEQSEPVVFGFWVFLMSDLITFGILFATYVAMNNNTAGGPGPRELYDFTRPVVAAGYSNSRPSIIGCIAMVPNGPRPKTNIMVASLFGFSPR